MSPGAWRLPLPALTQDYMKMAMVEVSLGDGKRTKVDDELTKTRCTYMSSLNPVKSHTLRTFATPDDEKPDETVPK